MDNNNNKKSKLIFIALIAIIAVLFVGIVYQFVVIKSLQKEIADLNSSFSIFLNNLWNNLFL